MGPPHRRYNRLVAPLVSVILPVHSPHPRYFREAVDSVLAQSLADFELIVIEDPSDSSARDILASLTDSRIRHEQNPVRTSLPLQHNRGLSLSRGRFICRFDADDICEPERLARQVGFLETHPTVDVVGSAVTVIDETGAAIGIRHYPTEHEDIARVIRRLNPIANSSVMFRREVYEHFGGWRSDSPLPAQDYAWYSRLAAGGARFANLPEPLIRYRLHGRSIKSTRLRATLQSTIEVKETYWSREMNLLDRAMLVVERLLLLVPERLVLWIFRNVRYRRMS